VSFKPGYPTSLNQVIQQSFKSGVWRNTNGNTSAKPILACLPIEKSARFKPQSALNDLVIAVNNPGIDLYNGLNFLEDQEKRRFDFFSA
jgi:hypothetical protein